MGYALAIAIFSLLPASHAEDSPEANEVFLSLISSDYTKKTYGLLIETDAKGSITGIRTKNNLKKTSKFYQNDVLHKDIVLAKALGVSLVVLKCRNFRPQTGCAMTIEYPSNLTLGKFKTFEAELKKSDDGSWGLFAGGRRFTQLRLIARKALGLLVGIKRIEPS